MRHGPDRGAKLARKLAVWAEAGCLGWSAPPRIGDGLIDCSSHILAAHFYMRRTLSQASPDRLVPLNGASTGRRYTTFADKSMYDKVQPRRHAWTARSHRRTNRSALAASAGKGSKGAALPDMLQPMVASGELPRAWEGVTAKSRRTLSKRKGENFATLLHRCTTDWLHRCIVAHL